MGAGLITRLSALSATYDRAISAYRIKGRTPDSGRARDALVKAWDNNPSLTAIVEDLLNEGAAGGTADAIAEGLQAFAEAGDVRARYEAHKALKYALQDARTQCHAHASFCGVFEAKGQPVPAWTERKDVNG